MEMVGIGNLTQKPSLQIRQERLRESGTGGCLVPDVIPMTPPDSALAGVLADLVAERNAPVSSIASPRSPRAGVGVELAVGRDPLFKLLDLEARLAGLSGYLGGL